MKLAKIEISEVYGIVYGIRCKENNKMYIYAKKDAYEFTQKLKDLSKNNINIELN